MSDEINRGMYAIMGVDPGETTGVSLMHVYANIRTKRLPNHAIVRFRAYEVEHSDRRSGNLSPQQDRMEALFQTERKFHVADPFLKYTRMAEQLLQIWLDFRRHSVRYYGIPRHNTFLAIEDWLMPPQIKTRSRETLSPIYVAHRLVGMLYGMADAHERNGFGPSHVGSVAWITPAERGSSEIFSDEKLERAGLLRTPKSHYPHANDATRIALAFARKGPNIPGLITPYNPKPENLYGNIEWGRPDPMERFGAYRVDDPKVNPDSKVRPVHLADGFALDPADPAVRIPSRKRALSRSGQPELAKTVAEQNKGKKRTKKADKPRNAFDRP